MLAGGCAGSRITSDQHRWLSCFSFPDHDNGLASKNPFYREVHHADNKIVFIHAFRIARRLRQGGATCPR
jgi:hypothetical protein